MSVIIGLIFKLQNGCVALNKIKADIVSFLGAVFVSELVELAVALNFRNQVAEKAKFKFL